MSPKNAKRHTVCVGLIKHVACARTCVGDGVLGDRGGLFHASGQKAQAMKQKVGVGQNLLRAGGGLLGLLRVDCTTNGRHCFEPNVPSPKE